MIRDGKAGLAPKAFGAALQLRFAQNDIIGSLVINGRRADAILIIPADGGRCCPTGASNADCVRGFAN
jgi:hypothetical protein